MKVFKFSGRFLMLIALGLATTISLSSDSCGSDDSPSSSSSSGGDNAGGNNNGGKNPSATARSLSISFNGSRLTNTDLITQGEVEHLKQVPIGEVTVTIEDLPTSVEELQKLKLPSDINSISDVPYFYPILLVAAINKMATDKQEAKAMVNFVSKGFSQETIMAKNYHFPSGGAADTYATDWSQLSTQYASYAEIRSYLDGATKSNSYSPRAPYTMTMELKTSSYSASDWDWFKFYIKSSLKSSQTEFTIWRYDSDKDGRLDSYFTTELLKLAHSVLPYK
ncbi:MAG: hypothetical protein II136_05530 [Prevotella sp.]|nr:hypothetical protein [Prevotella sp.]MBQ2059680.1 hypothetical protein [Prevotella sp.]